MEMIQCEGCLYTSGNTNFCEYYIHNNALQAAVNKNKLILCFICRRIAFKVDLFIKNILKVKDYFGIKPNGKSSDEENNLEAIVSLSKTCIQFIEIGVENSEIEALYSHTTNPDGMKKCDKQSNVFDGFDSTIPTGLKYEDDSEHVYNDELVEPNGKSSDEENNLEAIVSLSKTCIQFIEIGVENSEIEALYSHTTNPDGMKKCDKQSNVFDGFDSTIPTGLKYEDDSEHVYNDELVEVSQLDVIVKDENVLKKCNHEFIDKDITNEDVAIPRNEENLPQIGPKNISTDFKNENKSDCIFQNETKTIHRGNIKNENTDDEGSCMDLKKSSLLGKPLVRRKRKTKKRHKRNIQSTKDQCIEERKKMLSLSKYLKAPYKCEDCIKGYVYRDSYEKHMISHSEKSGNYECNICKQRRKTKNLLLKHRTLHFRQYSCKLCKYTRLSPVSIDEHYNAAHSSLLLYECSICNKKYWKRTLLKKHIAYKHSECTRVACDLCGKTYVNAYSLRTHVHTVHASETDTPPMRKEHVCTHCGAAFRHASLLRAHSVKHTDTKLFYCVECDKNFKSESTLKQHLRLAAPHVNCDVLPYPCGDCSEKFSSARSRAAHRNKVHLHTKPFQCTMCDKAYHSGWALAGHTKYSHETQERKHACTYCDKKFKRKYVLLHHIRTHTGERPHQCRLCPAAFAQSSVLWRHMRTVHTLPGDADNNK